MASHKERMQDMRELAGCLAGAVVAEDEGALYDLASRVCGSWSADEWALVADSAVAIALFRPRLPKDAHTHLYRARCVLHEAKHDQSRASVNKTPDP